MLPWLVSQDMNTVYKIMFLITDVRPLEDHGDNDARLLAKLKGNCHKLKGNCHKLLHYLPRSLPVRSGTLETP